MIVLTDREATMHRVQQIPCYLVALKVDSVPI
jgi:hypothetical protein